MNITFQFLSEKNLDTIVDAFKKANWIKGRSIFETYLKEQSNHVRVVWLAFLNQEFAGYITLKWQSKYMPFAKEDIPEIMDLNVLPDFRGRGIASQLLNIAEQEAFTKCKTVGIGVGLYKDYGIAQKLYIRSGYLPDGNGLTYGYQSVTPGSKVIVDDDLVLWFRKTRD